MNENDREILLILQEECAEVIVEICKILRFGPDQCKPGTNETNIQALQQELGDVTAMVELLVKARIGVTSNGISAAKKAKFEKLKTWSNLSINNT